MSIVQNLAAVQQRIHAACQQSRRAPEAVTLVCVTKTVAPAAIREAYAAGARHFGENYGQDLRDKAAALDDCPELCWHFIGALQRNKVKYAAGRTTLIHSIDSAELIAETERRAAAAGQKQEVLLELNLSGESSKSGAPVERLEELLACFAGCTCCYCTGLMTMPPFYDEPELARPYFARLRSLLEENKGIPRPQVSLHHLSMGMSGDFEVAIEEGATIVRVGTAIFGLR